MTTWARAAAICAGMAFGIGMAAAEPVFLRSGSGERGGGWLFGARDGQCWIALPRHVAARAGQPVDRPLFYLDRAGQAGETAAPIAVDTRADALEATGGEADLAFARVTAGRAPGGCTSRLGLPPLAYAAVLRGDPEVTFEKVDERTSLRIPMQVSRQTNDRVEGATLLLRPREEKNVADVTAGVSGGVASVVWMGERYPFAMALAAPDGQVRALRFDMIAAAFAVVETPDQAAPAPADTAAARPDVVSIAAQVDPSGTPLSALGAPGACWRAAPLPGKRAVEIVLAVPGDRALTRLRLVSDPACGPDATAYVETAPPGSGNWSAAASGCAVLRGDSGGCRLARRAPLDLRLKIVTPGGYVGLSAILLD